MHEAGGRETSNFPNVMGFAAVLTAEFKMNSNVKRFAEITCLCYEQCRMQSWSFLLAVAAADYACFFIMQNTIALCAYSHARYRVCTLTYSRFLRLANIQMPSSCTRIKFTRYDCCRVALQRVKTFIAWNLLQTIAFFLIVAKNTAREFELEWRVSAEVIFSSQILELILFWRLLCVCAIKLAFQNEISSDCGRLRLGACMRTFYTCIASNRYFMRESTQKGIYICEFIPIRPEREMPLPSLSRCTKLLIWDALLPSLSLQIIFHCKPREWIHLKCEHVLRERTLEYLCAF